MKLYKNWIEKKEVEGLKNNMDFKLTHDFDWGLDAIEFEYNDDPIFFFESYNQANIENSFNYFIPQPISPASYKLNDNLLTFPSTISSNDDNNNLARFNYFPIRNSERVVIIVPHWIADGHTYDKVAKFINILGYSAIRMQLPYHDARGDHKKANATKMVSANIGMTLQSVRQSVQDVIICINWLEQKGYKQIGIMGASIGTCIAFLAACHDSRIKGFFGNFISSYFGDVVWTGISTQHIRKSIERYNEKVSVELKVTQDILRKLWMLNSPIAFVDKLKLYNPQLKISIVSGKYDSTFIMSLTKLILDELDKNQITYNNKILACGHYSLGKYIFKILDGILMFKFFRILF